MRIALFTFTTLIAITGQGRVFALQEQMFSTYIRATGGLSSLSKDAFGSASGSSTTFSDEVDFNFSGEVGLAINVGPLMVRLGAEGLVPKDVEQATGINNSGTELLNVNSEILSVIPTLAVEMALYQEPTARFFCGASLGKASVSLKNTYNLTADGTTAFSVSDYEEVATGSTIGGSIFSGIESLLTDNVTFTAEVGYRVYQFGELKYKQASSTINGNFAEGDVVLNSDGSKRSLNLSGIHVGLGLRFYIAW